MVVFTYADEFTSPVSPARLFKALILDARNLIPKIIPSVVTSIEIVEGDGLSAGSIRKINFVEGSEVKCVKNLVEEVDEENFIYRYSMIEGEALILEKVGKISYEVKFEERAEGGSLNKMTSIYYTKGDVVLSQEEITAGKGKALAIYKIVEGYLLQNPHAYAN